MQSAAAPHAKVRFVAGRAEETGLKSHSVDLVLSAQSFHWFRPMDTLAECARILKPGRRLAIIWNRRSKTDPLTEGYRRAIADVGGESSIEHTAFDPDVVARSGLFAPVERTSFPNGQRLDLDGLLGRARSASYCPKDGPAAERLRELLSELWKVHADRNGLVTLVYETEVYRSHVL
jgi:SAM-dependent methyltransferase